MPVFPPKTIGGASAKVQLLNVRGVCPGKRDTSGTEKGGQLQPNRGLSQEKHVGGHERGGEGDPAERGGKLASN